MHAVELTARLRVFATLAPSSIYNVSVAPIGVEVKSASRDVYDALDVLTRGAASLKSLAA